jgi:hypothetical protein
MFARPYIHPFMEHWYMPRPIQFSIVLGDITDYESDVVALKYARSFHGADQAVALKLSVVGIDVSSLEAPIGKYSLVQTNGGINAAYALYVGVETLGAFRYEAIRKFAGRVLNICAEEGLEARRIAMTLHGANYGLDESEAMIQQFNGIMQILAEGTYPPALEQIVLVERQRGRVQRLIGALKQHVMDMPNVQVDDLNEVFIIQAADPIAVDSKPREAIPPSSDKKSSPKADPPTVESPRERRAATPDKAVDSPPKIEPVPESKPHAFIAMPFKKEMDDIFYYGIQQPVHGAGLLCERVDQDAFTGGIMEYVRQRIETAAVVIAELTGANPNVYLEVGYAWGKQRPTILIVKDEKELHFDVRGQRCLTYESIRNLEEMLSKEIKAMMLKGIIKP